MLVGFRPHCVANLDDRGVPCARYTQRLRKLQASSSSLLVPPPSRLHLDRSLIRCPTFTLNRPALALIIAQLLGPHHRPALALITAAYPAPTPCAQVSFSQLEKRKRSRLHSFQWDNHSSSLSLSDVLLLLIDRRGSGQHH